MRLVVCAFLCAIGVFVGAHHVLAQASAGITVIPARVDERADAGSEQHFTFTVKNESDTDKEYFVYIRDITGVDDGNVPLFADPNQEKTPFEMSEWLSVPFPSVQVPARGTVEVPLTMRVPADASPGSHFAALFVSEEPPRLRETGAAVGYEIASTIHIRIAGTVTDSARVRSFSTDKLIYGDKDIRFTTKVENQGNILIRPRGPVTLTGMFGGEPQVFMVNENESAVFPYATRDYETTYALKGFAFGRYEAEVALVYEGENGQKTIDASLVFWVFPVKIVLSVLAAFVLIFFLGWFFTRYYVNQAIMRASGGRRIQSARYRRQTGISRALFVLITVLTVLALFLIAALVLMA